MNKIVSQSKEASKEGGGGIRRSRLILFAAILALYVTSSPGLLSPFGSVHAASGVEATSLTPSAPEQSRRAAALEAYGKLPLSFEANQGQTDSQVKFLSRGRGYKLFLTSTEAVLVLRQQAAGNRQQATGKIERVGEANSALSTQHSALQTVLRMKLVGANPEAQMELEELAGKVNYFIGNDSAQWRTNVSTYRKAHYRKVYPGVELIYYGNQGQLEYDFIVAPGADPTAIRLSFEGADKIEIDDQGDLLLHVSGGEVRLRKPSIYQESDGARQEISGGYVLNPKSKIENLKSYEVGFQVAAYDVSRPLVIDPVLNYSTYLGGGGNDVGHAIAVDSAGSGYVTGSTDSADFPMLSGVQGSQGGTDAFVTKLSANGSALLYSTYLGGSGNDSGLAIAVDSAGNAYVTGLTESNNFPTKLAFQFDQGGTDAFVTKLSPDGSALVYSTYLGGSGNDVGHGIAVNSAGNAYVTGSTDSTDFPTLNALQGPQGATDAFVTKLSADGSAFLYSTYLGGGGNDSGYAIALDSAGNGYVTGSTDSTNFPMLNGVQGPQGATDAFVTKLSADGLAFLYSTYLGGSGNDSGLAIAVSPAGRAYVTGGTDSNNFPVKKSFQGDQGGTDAFVARLNPALSGLNSLLYSTYLGGSGNDVGYGIAVDSEGSAYVTGSTGSTDFPTLNGVQGFQGGTDAFVTKVDPTASGSASLLYSTYLGGSGNDEGYGIGLDSAGNAYVTGLTESVDFPVIGGLVTTLGGLQDAFVAKVVQPDLIVGAFSVPSTGGAGSTISVNNTTKNQGAAAAEASTTKFYLSTDTNLDGGDVLLGGQAIPTLAPGEASAGSTELAIPAGTAAGSYFVLAKVDADNVVAEAFEQNNKSSRAIQIVHGPDLLISALSAEVGPGSTITATDTTKNQGVISADASTTKFYLSTDTTLSAGDVLLGNRAIPTLAADATSTASTTLTIPAGTAGGNYYIIAKADADSVVSEVNEGNNTKVTNAITIRPDLIVSTVSAPSVAGAGLTISVTDTTKNQGVVSADASTTKFYLSTDTALSSGDVLLGNRAIPTLAADATSTASTTLTIPAGTAAGSYYIIAQADGDSAVAENNENNNATASSILAIGADLIVSAVFAPSTAGAGATIFVSNTTKNQGGGAVGPSTTKLFLSTDTALDAADILLGSRAIPALAAGGTSVESTALTIPAGTATGTYYIIAKADADNAVAESDEANNATASNAFTIGADLIVSALTAPSTATPGAAISVTDATKNQGGGSAGASTTMFFLSTDTNLDSADLLLGSRAIPALAAGATSSGSTTLTLPVGISGIYYVLAKANADGAVLEINGSNNTASSTAITLSPDLVVSAFSVPSASGAGLTVSVTDTTKNQGVVSANASTTKFYLSADANLDSTDLLLGSRAIPALAPGALDSGLTALTIPPGMAAGSYYIIAKADADATVLEIDESNNTIARAIAIGPDLIISLLSGPEKADTGLVISMTETTKNDGGGSAAASTTKFFLSSDTVLDPGDIFLGSRVVPALAPGGASAETSALTIPMGTASGSYYIIAQADADNGVAEINEGNNIRASHPIKIGPELNVDALTAQPNASAGAAIVVNDTVINRGGGSAGASTIKFFLSSDMILDAGDALLGSRAVPALAPGASSAGSTSVTIPAGIPGGTYYILAQADADNTVDELDEGNNVRAKSILIGPDLTVWFDLPASASTAAPGSTISVTDTTKNDGYAGAGASTTKFFLSTDTTLDAGDVLAGSRAVPALAPGETSTASNTLTIPAGIAGGAYYIIAQADADNAVSELNKNNNIAVSSKTVLIGPDLIVWLDLPASASSAVPGSTLSVTDFTKNDSFVAAGASTTKFYLSTDTTLDAGDLLLGSRAVPALVAGVINSGSTPVTLPAGLTGGTYYILAQADGDNVVAEINEGNNVTASTVITIGPDLIAWLDLPASSTTAAPGSTISVTDFTKNDSLVAAGASTTKFYLSTDTTLDAGDILLGSRAVPALAAGAISSASTPLTLPAVMVGAYYILARADADNTVAEINEGNNTTASSTTILIGADLIVWMDIAATTHPPYAGETISVTDNTKNESLAAAGASTTKFFLSTDTVLDAGDLLLGSRAVPALAGGAISSAVSALVIPAGTVPGSYYIIAQADANNAVLEFNEGNNTIAKPITIAADQYGSDLIVWLDLPASSSTAAAGSTVLVTDYTKNDSLVAAGASTTKFYLSTDTILDAGDILIGSRAIPALAPGVISTASNGLIIPAGVGGTFYVIAQADADNAVSELSENNNTSVSSRTILIGPDLIVWLDLPASSTTVSAGSTIFINDVTKNDSFIPAGASITKLFLSGDMTLDAGDIPLGSRAIPALAPGASSSGSTPLTLPATIAGTYYILAQADADKVVAEFNEGNNITASSPIAVGPDLVITGVTAPSKTGAGLTIYVNETTKNKGGGSAGATTTAFFLSTDTILDAGDLLLGSRAIPALAPSEYNSGTTAVIIPATIPAGTYYILAQADVSNAIAEASESNNSYAKVIEILPDLIVSALAAPSKAYPNSAITVSDTTKNQGAGSSASTTGFFLSTDTILDAGDTFLGSRVVPALASGAVSKGSTSVTIPAAVAGGSYYIIAQADADNAVSEFNETNNTRYKSLTIGPDLAVSALSVPSTGVAGSTISITDTTINWGSPSAASKTKFFLSTNASLGASDILLGSRAISALNFGDASSGSTALTLPAGTAAGSYYIIAQADGDNIVAELIETNNTKASAITIGSSQ